MKKVCLLLSLFIMMFLVCLTKVNAETYQYCDYKGDCTEVEEGTVVVLPEFDDSYNNFTDSLEFNFRYNYYGSPSKIDEKTVSYTGEFKNYKINAFNKYLEYYPGESITVDRNITLGVNYTPIATEESLPVIPERDGYVFLGWYDAATKGKRIDVEHLEQDYYTYKIMKDYYSDTPTLYAHWAEFDPETQALVLWDNDPLIYEKGTTVDLDRENSKSLTIKFANIEIDAKYPNYNDLYYNIYLNKERNSYLINGVINESNGLYVITENTIINSQYTLSIVYPDLPEIDYDNYAGISDENWQGQIGPLWNSFEGIENKCSGSIYEECYINLYMKYYSDKVDIYLDGDYLFNVDRYQSYDVDTYFKNNRWTYFWFDFETPNIENPDKVSMVLIRVLDYYLINGYKYSTGKRESHRFVDTTYVTSVGGKYTYSGNYDAMFTYGDFDIGRQLDDGNGNYSYLEGWYTEPGGQGHKIDFYNVDKSLLTADAYNSAAGQHLYAKWTTNTDLNVTIDGNGPYVYQRGTSTLIPNEIEVNTTKPDDTFSITFDYQDGETPSEVSQVSRSYTFHHFTVNGSGSYQRDSSYNFRKDSSIESYYNVSYSSYPEVPTVDSVIFTGWYTAPLGGTKITSSNINTIKEDATIYAHYYYDHDIYGRIFYTIEGDVEAHYVEPGYALTLEDLEPVTDEITLNLIYGYGYPNKQVHFNVTKTLDYWQIYQNGSYYSVEPNEVFIITKTSRIWPEYTQEISNDFSGYYDDENWDTGMIITDPYGGQYTLDYWYTKYSYSSTYSCQERGCLANEEGSYRTEFEYYYNESFEMGIAMDNTNVYAYFSPGNWSVSVDFYDNIEGDFIDSTWADVGGTLYEFPTDTEKDGYLFDGWYWDYYWVDRVDENTKFYTDSTVTSRWIEDIRDNDNQCLIVTEDDSTVIINKGETYQLGVNNNGGGGPTVATVTFKYQNGVTSDTTRDILEKTRPNGWYYSIDGEDYTAEDNSIITCNSDLLTIRPRSNKYYQSDPFPTPPARAGYSFKGWYDEPVGGYKFTRYEEPLATILYGQWEEVKISVTLPDNTVEIRDYGDTYTLGINDLAKADENGATITYKFNDSVTPDATDYVVKSFTPNGWLVNDVVKADETVLTLTEPIEIEYNYTESKSSPEFPTPTREHYVFDGWYDAEIDGELVESYTGDDDINLYAYWTGEEITVTLPDDTTEAYHYGDTYTLGINDVAKANGNGATITFKYQDNETADTTDYVIISYTSNGWLVNDVETQDETVLTLTEPIEIEYNYTESKSSPEFPAPTRDNYTFLGWYDEEENGELVESYAGDENINLYAYWNLDKPTDFELDSYELNLVVGDSHQIIPTYMPEGTEDTLVYSGYDDEVISVTEEGLITALSSGETTITVALESDNTITKEISVSVMGDKITSSSLQIIDKVTYQIIIGEEPNTKIETILGKINNNEYIKVYTKNDELVDPDNYSTELIKTGMKLKLVINEVEKDEVIVVIRGDVDGDGLVNVTDLAPVEWHILEDERDYLEGYYKDAVDLDGDGIVDVRDEGKLLLFILEDESVPTLND